MKTLSNYVSEKLIVFHPQIDEKPVVFHPQIDEKPVVFHPQIDEKLIVNKEYNVDEKCPFELGTNFFVINLAISSSSEKIDRTISIDKFTVYDFANTDKNKVDHDVKIYKSTSVYMVGDNTQQYGVCTYKIKQTKNKMQYGIYLNNDYTDNIKKLIDFMINQKTSHQSIVLRKLFEILDINNPFNKIDIEPGWSFTYSSYTLNELIRLKEKL